MTTMSALRCLTALTGSAVLLAGCAGSGAGPDPSSTHATSGSTSGTADGQSSPSSVISASPPSEPTGDGLRPRPGDAFEDQPPAYDDDCQNSTGTEVLTCRYGTTDAETTVALVGDSKALQWVSAFDTIGTDRGWRIVTMTKSTCAWADAYVSSDGQPNAECWEWGQQAKKEVLDLEPDLVVTSFGHNMASPSESSTDFSREGLVEGLVGMWDELADAGVPVAALTDTPNSGEIGDVPECVAEHGEDHEACTIEDSEGTGTPAMRAAVKQARSATLVDLTGVLCPEGTCRPVFGDVLVQRDGSHITDTFVREVTPSLEGPLTTLVEGST